jgi:hypothetical protein
MSEGRELCRSVVPELAEVSENHFSACHFWDDVADEVLRVAAATGMSAREGRLD